MRQLTLKVIANGEAAAKTDERNAFVIRAQPGRDAEFWVGSNDAGRISRSRETDGGESRAAGIMDRRGALWMQKRPLRLAEIGKAGLIDRARI